MSEFSHVNVNFLENSKLSTKMIKGVVVCLIFCYLPYLAWWQYAIIVFPRWHLIGDPICCKQISVKPEEVNMPSIILNNYILDIILYLPFITVLDGVCCFVSYVNANQLVLKSIYIRFNYSCIQKRCQELLGVQVWCQIGGSGSNTSTFIY